VKRIAEVFKDRQRDDNEDRCAIFRDWLRDHNTPCQDVDLMYYWMRDEEVVPVAILEITRRDDIGCDPPPSYFQAILDRYHNGSQAVVAEWVARRLGAPAYIVVFCSSMTRMWLWNLTDPKGWKEVTPNEYLEWIKHLFNVSQQQPAGKAAFHAVAGSAAERQLNHVKLMDRMF
jgi:hypothetical protein